MPTKIHVKKKQAVEEGMKDNQGSRFSSLTLTVLNAERSLVKVTRIHLA